MRNSFQEFRKIEKLIFLAAGLVLILISFGIGDKLRAAEVSTSWLIVQVSGLAGAAGPTVSCGNSPGSTSFETLSATAIATSAPNISATMSCSNTASGCTLYVKDANAGLATTSPAYTIPSPNAAASASTTLSIGVEGYGIQATTTSTGLSIAARYLLTGNDVGGLTLTNQTFASSSADITNAEVIVTHKAAISDLTIAAKYEDTITYECVVN